MQRPGTGSSRGSGFGHEGAVGQTNGIAQEHRSVSEGMWEAVTLLCSCRAQVASKKTGVGSSASQVATSCVLRCFISTPLPAVG